MRLFKIASAIITLLFVNIACEKSYTFRDRNESQAIEDSQEAGAFTSNEILILQSNRSQLKKAHRKEQQNLEREQERIERELELVNRTLGTNQRQEKSSDNDPGPQGEDTGQDESHSGSLLQELEALDESDLEARLQAFTEEINDLNFNIGLAATDQEENQLEAQLALHLQEIRLINNILAEKRNKDFNYDLLKYLSAQELTHIQKGLQEELARNKIDQERIEYAVYQIDYPSLTDYRFVRVKMFPNQNGRKNFPNVRGEDQKYAKLQNKGGFQVQRIDLWSNRVLEDLGQAHTIETFFNCPETATCSTNRITLNKNRTFTLDSSSAVAVIPLQNVSSEGDDYFEAGFTQLEYKGVKNGTHSPYLGFFRGGFRIQFARQGKTSQEDHWSIINVVSLDEYLLAVVPAELSTKKNEIEARKAQIIIARTYYLNRARLARTHSNRPRLWDVLPTTASQLYIGAKGERADYYQAIRDTRGQIVIRDDRPALAEFFSCSEPRTKSVKDVPEQESRTVPSDSCKNIRKRLKNKGDGVFAYGHGRGFCQLCAVALVNGWSPADPRQPTPGANVPSNPYKQWSHDEMIRYFFNGTYISDIRELPEFSQTSI